MKARKLLESMKKHFPNLKVNEEDGELKDLGLEVEPEAEPMEEEGEELASEPVELIEELIDGEFSSDNASQADAVKKLDVLANSDAPESNKFMEALDNFTSSLDISEDADGEALYVFNKEKWDNLSEKCKK